MIDELGSSYRYIHDKENDVHRIVLEGQQIEMGLCLSKIGSIEIPLCEGPATSEENFYYLKNLGRKSLRFLDMIEHLRVANGNRKVIIDCILVNKYAKLFLRELQLLSFDDYELAMWGSRAKSLEKKGIINQLSGDDHMLNMASVADEVLIDAYDKKEVAIKIKLNTSCGNERVRDVDRFVQILLQGISRSDNP
ncbi:MAG: hypothetical protein IT350_10445 [Deltaproteobacteria bacterium]|nr:hypothetical protein [Deltaproteobacteria bacterium]